MSPFKMMVRPRSSEISSVTRWMPSDDWTALGRESRSSSFVDWLGYGDILLLAISMEAFEQVPRPKVNGGF